MVLARLVAIRCSSTTTNESSKVLCSCLSVTVTPRQPIMSRHVCSRGSPGDSAAPFTAALHTYFAVSDISAVTVEGLDGVTYSDSLADGAKVTQAGAVKFDREVDRIYIATPDDAIKVCREGCLHVWGGLGHACLFLAELQRRLMAQLPVLLCLAHGWCVDGPRSGWDPAGCGCGFWHDR